MIKRFVIVSQWGYPAGGGEAFLLNSAQWLLAESNKIEWQIQWISFQNFDGTSYDKFRVYKNNSIIFIQLPSIDLLTSMIRLLRPDVIHHQGNFRMEIIAAAKECRIPLITGFHFWTDAIELYNGNRDIRRHMDKHRPSENLGKIIAAAPMVSTYACSEYVRNIIMEVSGHLLPTVIHPLSSLSPINSQHDTRKYITIINIHPAKGGNLLLRILPMLFQYPLLLIQTESIAADFRSKLDAALQSNQTRRILTEGHQEAANIYKRTKVLLIPSEVDETFCRVCAEAMQTRTPIITSGNGNIRNLVGNDYPFICDTADVNAWIAAIKLLYENQEKNREIAERLYEKYCRDFDLQNEKRNFANLVAQSANYLQKRIGILTTWCDQGLGIQCRNYARILREYGFIISIFSFRPYIRNSAQELQTDSSEWEGYDVYYSRNTREGIGDDEISEFVEKRDIGQMIIPETCWFRIFEIARLLRTINVRTYAIPNIEIVRRDELYKHKYFDYILTNNRLCERLFRDRGFANTIYLGYGTLGFNNNFDNQDNRNPEQIKFLFIGGLNGFSRKQCLEVCRSFQKIADERARLTITLLDNIDDRIREFENHPNIDIKIRHHSYQEICELYRSHDVFIQVSKHEGLGLGFYDAIANGIPTLTLDTPPHNEIITDEIGWRIPCHYKPMTDNNDALIESAYFDEDDLANKIGEIIRSDASAAAIQEKKRAVCEFCQTNYTSFVQRLMTNFASDNGDSILATHPTKSH